MGGQQHQAEIDRNEAAAKAAVESVETTTENIATEEKATENNTEEAKSETENVAEENKTEETQG